jgi:hypothetical protein
MNRHVNRNAANQLPATTLLSWQEALAIIEQCDARGIPIPFSVAFCTCDESKGTGGEIIRYQKAVWYVAGGRVKQTADFQKVGAVVSFQKKRSAKSNWMKRLMGFGTNEIRQVHIHLILEINGQPVR